MDCQDSLFYAIAMQRLPGVGPRLYNRLERLFQEPRLLFHAKPHELQAASVGPEIQRVIGEWQDNPGQHPLSRQVQRDLQWLGSRADVHVIHRDDPLYPPLLHEIANPPALLYVRGQPEVLGTPQLALVGARKASQAGCRQARAFARGLAERGVTVTSGLALGIDAAAHQAALDAGGLTVGFIATGIDICYPRRHLQLASAICMSGVIVSEFPLGAAPKRDHFPRRNRLISGASMGVLVVEAAAKSGSLITANYALEQSREVFAVPGSIQNPLSRGCNALLKQGAKLVEQVDDIIEELNGFERLFSQQKDAEAGVSGKQIALISEHENTPDCLGDEEKALLESMAYSPQSLDELVLASGLASTVVSGALVNLEIHGLVESFAGLYQRC